MWTRFENRVNWFVVNFAWLIVVLLLGGIAEGALIYEPFDYTAGAGLAGLTGGTGFGSPASAWADNQSGGGEADNIGSGSLSYGGTVGTGNSLRMTDVSLGSTDTRTFPIIAGTAGTQTWISFLMSVQNPPAGGFSQSDGAYFFVRTGSGLSPRWGVFDNGSGQKYFGMSSSDAGDYPQLLSSVKFQSNVTYLVVCEIDWVNAVSQNDPEVIRLYVNPQAGSASPPTYDLQRSDLNVATGSTGASGTNRLDRMGFASGEAGTEWIFDEVKIGSSYVDVIPVPEISSSPLVFAVMLASGIFAIFRRVTSLR